jgi:cobalt-zinc-cadmium efflux system protein
MTAAHGAQRRALRIALAANGAFLVVEVVAGLAFGSLALLADSAHMAIDVVALSTALLAHRLGERPATTRHTYGLKRAEVIGGLANAVLLLVVTGALALESVRRLADPLDVQGGGLLAVALIGLAINLGSAALLARSGARTLNVRAAILHLLGDAAGSGAAAVAGLAVVLGGADWADPAASLAVCLLVVASAWKLLRDALHVLLEGAPSGLDLQQVARTIRSAPGVEDVHHLHAWSLASDEPALSAHVVLAGEIDLHRAQSRGADLKALLEDRHGLAHVTLELECHACDPADPLIASS